MGALLIALILALTGIFRVESPALDAIAAARAHEIATTGVEHRYLDELNNGQWSAWGEVLAWNRGFDDPVQAAVDGWASSPEHLAILSNAKYTQIGCGSEYRETDSEAASSGWYFVCILARPAAGGTIPNAAAHERGVGLVAMGFVLVLLMGTALVRRRPC
jgi:hypothetical protein